MNTTKEYFYIFVIMFCIPPNIKYQLKTYNNKQCLMKAKTQLKIQFRHILMDAMSIIRKLMKNIRFSKTDEFI